MAPFRWFVALTMLSVVSADSNDEIVDLPGLSFKPNFKHYSGYLRASKTRFLHYWFVESQGSPSADPLIFWFNGGPGCSSLEGLLAEHGPYFLSNDTHTLVKNPYAWNKLANVVYVEAPAGVGLSYTIKGDDGDYNDDRTSAESYEAMKKFFEKFPQFRNSSVFITGESYAGMYVPTLASRIIDGQKEFPVRLDGIAIGNGLLNVAFNDRSSIEFWYGHGFVEEGVFKAFDKCCDGDIIACDLEKCNDQYGNIVLHEGANINPYDIYRDCHVPTFMPYSLRKPHSRFDTRESLPMIPPGVHSCNPYFNAYLDKHEVRRALHISHHVGPFFECNIIINDGYKWSEDMSPLIRKIITNNIRVLLYYGDTDGVCNFIGGQKFADSIGLNVKTRGDDQDPRQPWWLNGRLGGFKTEYEKNFTFITVRGVGHMVPQWQPAGAEYFMGQFLKNKPI